MGYLEIQSEMNKFKEEIEWVQMVPSIQVIEMIVGWDKQFTSLLDDSREKFERMLTDKRSEYLSIV